MNVDWSDRDQVIEYAKTFGPGHSVLECPNKGTYAVCHTSREHERLRWRKENWDCDTKIIHRT